MVPKIEKSAGVVKQGSEEARSRVAKRAVVALAVLGVAAGAVVLARGHHVDAQVGTSRGVEVFTLAKLVRSASAQPGGATLRLASGSKAAAAEGASIPAGAALETDARTRALLKRDGGATLAFDRASSAILQAGSATLEDGTLQVDSKSSAAAFTVSAAAATIESKGLFSVTKRPDMVVVSAERGDVQISTADGRVHETLTAGQEATLIDGRIERALARPRTLNLEGDDTTARTSSGLGELHAKKPGAADSTATALRIAKHDVRARVAGTFARTEIEEVFANDSDDVLEGVYRFRLPRGATIERLALDVDGQLIEGEFIDKAKAGKIWKGVIWNATAHKAPPKEDLVWVPGPWRDPALLDWSEDGVFTLKIYPIPKKGSRRLIVAYTERLPEVHGQREYRYPLPEGTAAKLGDFTLDLQVSGHDRTKGAKSEGYTLTTTSAGEDAERLAFAAKDFTPEGDMVVKYTLPDEKATVRAYGFEGDDGGKYVALAVKPDVPAFAEAKPRDVVLVVDSGRAMTGARYEEARALAREVAQGLDKRDRVDVVTCDLWCKPRKGGWLVPGAQAAADIDATLAAITPDGASDLETALRQNAGAKEGGRERVVVLISSGVGTFGASRGARLGSLLSDREDVHVIVAPVGTTASARQLGDLSNAATGVITRSEPDAKVGADNVLRALAGRTLRHPKLTLPEGLTGESPGRFPTMLAGDEMFVVAKADRAGIDGVVTLRGDVGGEPYERAVPIKVTTVKGAANAFVPRLFATARADELWTSQRPEDKTELVSLSQKWHVPSPYTSLLVLESEAMFKAFGIARSDHGVTWTGEESAVQATAMDSLAEARDEDDALSASLSGGFGDDKVKKDSSGPLREAAAADGWSGGGMGAATGRAMAPPASAPKAAAPSKPAEVSEEKAARKAPSSEPPLDARGRPMVQMRRTWVRSAQFLVPDGTIVSPSAMADARRALQEKPDAPARHAKLARLLVAAGASYDAELDALLATWEKKDPNDADLLDLRADRMAARGHRDEAMRIRSGTWSSAATDDTMRGLLVDSLAAAAATPEDACRFQTVSALLQPTRHDRVAQALACAPADARGELRTAFEASGLPKGNLALPSATSTSLRGDFLAKASWLAPVDVDLVLVGPDGRRYDLTSRAKGVTVRDARLKGAEQLAVTARGQGSYSLRVVRADDTTTPVDGRIEMNALGGHTRTVPFALAGRETEVARIAVTMKPVLTPVSGFGGRQIWE